MRSLDPSYSTGIVNVNGGATCFSGAAIYKTPTSAVFSPATDICIYLLCTRHVITGSDWQMVLGISQLSHMHKLDPLLCRWHL